MKEEVKRNMWEKFKEIEILKDLSERENLDHLFETILQILSKI